MPVGRIDVLERIIELGEIQALFQPIYDLSIPEIIGYEALVRGPADSALHNPVTLFETARTYKMLSELDYLCREICCKRFAALDLPGKLFLNVTPQCVLDNDHKDGVTSGIIEKYSLPKERVIIELTEHFPVDDYGVYQAAAEHYRNMGFNISVDDLGTGYNALRTWAGIRPEFIKIDRHFIENLNDDTLKSDHVQSISDISVGMGSIVIAEGIESTEELHHLKSISISYGQGNLLGRPATAPGRLVPNSLLQAKRSSRYSHLTHHLETVESLMEDGFPLSPKTSLGQAAGIVRAKPMLVSFPIVRDSVPVGVITRNRIMELCMDQADSKSNAKKTISEFMEPPVIVEYTDTLQKASRIITQNKFMDISMDFIVVKNGKYAGVGKIRNLLARITELQIRSARYANPLSLLPGNVPVNEWMDGLIKRKEEFVIAYCDVNNFKPFNDKYGYGCGDDVIVKISEILQAHADSTRDFVGHIGGDDFVVIFRSEDWQQRCDRILKDFERAAPGYYSPEDRTAGGILSVDRQGNKQFFDFLSLAIGVVKPDPARCSSHHDVAPLAADAKHQAKKSGGNTLFVSRRRGAGQDEPVSQYTGEN